jgi:UDP-glucuronate 4-epimerase
VAPQALPLASKPELPATYLSEMRIVVTGGAGFIGGHLVASLLGAGHQILILDAFRSHYAPAERRMLAQRLAAHERCDCRAVDLVTDDLDPHIRNADVVVHLAARAGVAQSWSDAFAEYSADNVVGLHRVLRSACATGVSRVVFASSSSIYGRRSGANLRRNVLAPMHPYGVTKLAGEQLCRAHALAHPGVAIIMLRYFTVYGPRQRPDMAISRFIAAAEAGEPILLYGGGRQTRRFTYVGDVAEATLNACTVDLRGVHAFDVAGHDVTAVATIAEMVAEATGRVVAVRCAESAPGEPQEVAADLETTSVGLDWKPTTRLKEGLRQQVAWWRQSVRASPSTSR